MWGEEVFQDGLFTVATFLITKSLWVWMRSFVVNAFLTLWKKSIIPRFLTLIKEANLLQPTSLKFYKIIRFKSAWMAKADASTISLLRGFGEQLSKKMFTTSATKQWLKPRSVWVSLFCGIIMRGCIRALITERRIRFIAVCRFVILRRFFLNFLFLRKATLRFVIQGAHCRPLTR